MKPILVILLAVLFLLSCSKEKKTIPVIPPRVPEQWEKFVGTYNVYDTLGVFLYNMNINHLSSTYFQNGQKIDSLILINFNDTFNLKIDFNPASPGYENTFDIGSHDSIIDYNNKSWNISTLSDDLSTPMRENELINDSMIMYFRQTNIQYYINEAQPYYYCECKHVAVKQ